MEEHMLLLDVGMAAINESFDQRDDLWNMIGNTWFQVGRGDSKGSHVFMVGINEAASDVRYGRA
ncbi:hypothetical protein D3C81_1705410 [compost metagenome]